MVTDPAALARFNAGVARARAAYDAEQADPATRKAVDAEKRARRRAYDQARYRARLAAKETR